MSTLSTHTMPSSLVTSPLTYEILVPDDLPAGAPQMLWLHGGNGPGQFPSRSKPAFDACWAEGSLPSMVIVMPHSTRSFWLDGAGDDAAWETMLVDELVPHIRATHGAGEVTIAGGISMGGMGSLRLALRHSEVVSVVAALEPAIEPTAVWSEVPLRDLAYRLDAVEEVYGDPVDADRFRHNHPLAVAEANAMDVAANGLAIYFECGDEDMLNLHHGAEALHRRLWDIGLRHEYRSVRGANHVGLTVEARTIDALRFVGRALAPTEPDPEVELAEQFAASSYEQAGFRRSSIIDGPAGPIEVRECGTGEPVLMIPSLGRGAEDFDDLAHRLARAGYHAIHPQPRGIGGSAGELSGLTMRDLAADAAAVIHAVAQGPVTIVGHAFGNRVARMTATEYPHLIDSVVLLCCGGLVQPEPKYHEALLKVFDVEATDDEHHAAVDTAFFAPGNDASLWFEGWHGIAAAVQGVATRQQPVDYWWAAGGKDLFVVQPADDKMAVPANAEQLCEAFPDRASMVTVPRAGHALLPEQPDAVEVALRLWLSRSR